MLVQVKYTRDFRSLEAALKQFLSDNNVSAAAVHSCCMACAGPVVDNASQMTNLPWKVDGNQLERDFGFRCQVWLHHPRAAMLAAVRRKERQQLPKS
jgi:glucokinase